MTILAIIIDIVRESEQVFAEWYICVTVTRSRVTFEQVKFGHSKYFNFDEI